MGTEIDDRGRVTIPKPLRDRPNIEPGDEGTFEVIEGDILLHVDRTGLEAARRGSDWDDDAFLDAGAATFGGRGDDGRDG